MKGKPSAEQTPLGKVASNSETKPLQQQSDSSAPALVSSAGAYEPCWFERSVFDAKRQASGARWGRPLRLYDQLESTQDAAFAAFAEGAPSGALFVTHQQTQGRGRRGQTWQMQAGDCLTFSLLVRASETLTQLEGLSLGVGLALVESLKPLMPTAKLQLKWPNDVYLNHKKLAGILIEARQLKQERALVIGVGLNTSWLTPPTALRATSLKAEGIRYPGDPIFLETLLQHLERQISTVLTHGLQPLLPALRKIDFLQGREFILEDFSLQDPGQSPLTSHHQTLAVRGAGIAKDGCLLVEPLKNLSDLQVPAEAELRPNERENSALLAVQSAHIRL